MGKCWFDEDIERLKRDKNVLMQELLRLKQQQQTTDTLLQALTKHTQRMEQHQQQMMSFLSKAIQSPELLAQLVQQKSSQISGGNKKRKYPKEFEREIVSSDGQMINYQRTLLTDAAKSTLMQILTSDRLDSSFSKPESITQPQNSHLQTDSTDNSRISTICSSSLNMTVAYEEISQAVIDFQDECIADIPSISYLGSEADEMIPFELENFSGDAEFDVYMAGEDMKLPPAVDSSFWEKFL